MDKKQMGPVSKSTMQLPVLLASLLAFAGQPWAQGEAVGTTWAEGEVAPPLRLPTIDGSQTVDLYGRIGTPILLIEFASW